MAFNQAARDKALETRRRNALDRKLKKQNAVTGTATTQTAVDMVDDYNKITEGFLPPVTSIPVEETWNNMPLDGAVNRLANLKREYDMAAQIIMQRQSREPVVWTCWTQNHKDVASKTAFAQCKKRIPDGRWVSKDDGFKDETGKIVPQVTCSMICYQDYQGFRSKMRDKSRGL